MKSTFLDLIQYENNLQYDNSFKLDSCMYGTIVH